MVDFMNAFELWKAAIPPEMLAFVMAYMIVAIFVGLALYIYQSFAVMTTAKRLNSEPAWFAWVPILNLILLARMAKMPTWPLWFLLGLIVPFLNLLIVFGVAIFTVIWTWKICENRNKPGWWSILTLIPYVGPIWAYVMWGILAWGGNSAAPTTESPKV